MNRRFGAATGGAIVAALATALCLTPMAAIGATGNAVSPTGTEVSALPTSTYGEVLIWTGKAAESADGTDAPLYEFSGDANGKFGCTTRLVPSAFDIGGDGYHPFTCTGPESDFGGSGSETDDWPALTTTGTPLAGSGVNQKLLGTVNRPGIGHQVTYGGHPLYLFDAPSSPFMPTGEDYPETVLPLPPWHGIWYLVSSRTGQPAPGPATIETELLPNRKTALAAQENPNNGAAHAVTVYSFSRDQASASACTGACAATWMPVLTTGEPLVSGMSEGGPPGPATIAAKDLGVIHRPDGTSQVTYNGKPLYLYSEEKIYTGGSSPGYSTASGTVGNGNGLPGPGGGTFSVIYPG
jgi:predicted lipoprotein with Yx(FWY)xxD motif